jgi:hypothetical protein
MRSTALRRALPRSTPRPSGSSVSFTTGCVRSRGRGKFESQCVPRDDDAARTADRGHGVPPDRHAPESCRDETRRNLERGLIVMVERFDDRIARFCVNTRGNNLRIGRIDFQQRLSRVECEVVVRRTFRVEPLPDSQYRVAICRVPQRTHLPLVEGSGSLSFAKTAAQIATGRQVGAEIAAQLVEEIRGMGLP